MGHERDGRRGYWLGSGYLYGQAKSGDNIAHVGGGEEVGDATRQEELHADDMLTDRPLTAARAIALPDSLGEPDIVARDCATFRDGSSRATRPIHAPDIGGVRGVDRVAVLLQLATI